jgi:hypothetical protein
VTLADGSTLPVIRVGAVRFQMWDGTIRTVTDVLYVPGVRRSLVSLNELDSHEYELRIRGGSMEVLLVTWLSFGVLRAVVSMRWSVRWSPRPLSYRLALLLGEL